MLELYKAAAPVQRAVLLENLEAKFPAGTGVPVLPPRYATVKKLNILVSCTCEQLLLAVVLSFQNIAVGCSSRRLKGCIAQSICLWKTL